MIHPGVFLLRSRESIVGVKLYGDGLETSQNKEFKDTA